MLHWRDIWGRGIKHAKLEVLDLDLRSCWNTLVLGSDEEDPLLTPADLEEFLLMRLRYLNLRNPPFLQRVRMLYHPTESSRHREYIQHITDITADLRQNGVHLQWTLWVSHCVPLDIKHGMMGDLMNTD